MSDTSTGTLAKARRFGWPTLTEGLALATVLVPIAVAVIANSFGARVADRQARLELLKLSVSVLAQPATDSALALRQWAVRVLEANSDVTLPEALKRELEERLQLPRVTYYPLTGTPEGTAYEGAVFLKSDSAWTRLFGRDSLPLLRNQIVVPPRDSSRK